MVDVDNNTKANNNTSSMPSSLLIAHLASFSLSFVIIKSFWEFEDASGALASYGVYHRVGWNQVIHFFGVPGIIWSLLICFVHVPIPMVNIGGDNQSCNVQSVDQSFNYANFMAICYTLYYFSIDPLGAALYAPFIYAMYTSAVKLRQNDQAEAQKALKTNTSSSTTNNNGNNTDSGVKVEWYGTGKALRFALMVHFFCWYIQIHPGHAVIEGAKPAVLTGLGSALSTAPLFAFYEGLWLLGINKGLQESTQVLVDQYTQELCTKHGIEFMRACRTLVMQE